MNPTDIALNETWTWSWKLGQRERMNNLLLSNFQPDLTLVLGPEKIKVRYIKLYKEEEIMDVFFYFYRFLLIKYFYKPGLVSCITKYFILKENKRNYLLIMLILLFLNLCSR